MLIGNLNLYNGMANIRNGKYKRFFFVVVFRNFFIGKLIV